MIYDNHKSRRFINLLIWSSALIWPSLGFSSESLVLFHGGKRAYLEEDIRQKGISAEVWDKFIFGKTNFDLPEYRKGLYGASVLGDTSLYTTYALLAGQEPWVMAIKIKARCASNPGFYYTDYSISPAKSKDESLFSKWLSKKLNQADAELRKKIELDIQECSQEFSIRSEPPVKYRTWDENIFYSMKQHSAEEQNHTLRCAPYLNEFLNQTHIKLVQDNVNGEEGSWYIRDRGCIESISGTPDDLLRMISKNQIGENSATIDQNLFGDIVAPGHFPAGSLYVFLRVLTETTLLRPENIPLLNNIEKTMNFDRKNDAEFGEEALRLFKNQEFSFSTVRNVDIFVSMAIRAAKQAIKEHRVQEFQTLLAEDLTQLRIHHGESCQGGEGGSQGVRPENRAQCDQTSLLYGQKLMASFIDALKLRAKTK